MTFGSGGGSPTTLLVTTHTTSGTASEAIYTCPDSKLSIFNPYSTYRGDGFTTSPISGFILAWDNPVTGAEMSVTIIWGFTGSFGASYFTNVKIVSGGGEAVLPVSRFTQVVESGTDVLGSGLVLFPGDRIKTQAQAAGVHVKYSIQEYSVQS